VRLVHAPCLCPRCILPWFHAVGDICLCVCACVRGVQLKRHLQTHTDVFPFTCPEPSCQKKFKDQVVFQVRAYCSPFKFPNNKTARPCD
jgi:hypothetical protein